MPEEVVPEVQAAEGGVGREGQAGEGLPGGGSQKVEGEGERVQGGVGGEGGAEGEAGSVCQCVVREVEGLEAACGGGQEGAKGG